MHTQLPLVVTPQEYHSQQQLPRRRICDLPAEERPLYRLHQYGSSGLATTELLALVLGTAEAPGLSQELLDRFGSLHGLARASKAQLLRIHGIGETQAARLLDEGQGYAAWLVLPSPEAWQEVMQVGLKMKEIGF